MILKNKEQAMVRLGFTLLTLIPLFYILIRLKFGNLRNIEGTLGLVLASNSLYLALVWDREMLWIFCGIPAISIITIIFVALGILRIRPS